MWLCLPFINKTKTSLIVPAGSLHEQPYLQTQANIFPLKLIVDSNQVYWLRTLRVFQSDLLC